MQLLCDNSNLQVEGELPAEICGTFLQNGPGLFDIDGSPIPNPIDGDGMVRFLA